jgi:DNA end-binding protein Ku
MSVVSILEVTKEELENVASESTRPIETDEFVQRGEINPRCIIHPYYLRPDGKVGSEAAAQVGLVTPQSAANLREGEF